LFQTSDKPRAALGRRLEGIQKGQNKVDNQTATRARPAVQHGSTNPDSQLDPSAKRLMLSAHLNLVRAKLRRGLSVEEREILALLPFTIPNGSLPGDEAHEEIYGAPAGNMVDASDEHWWRRLAEVHQCSGIEADPR
jgi:hypothetical protein